MRWIIATLLMGILGSVGAQDKVFLKNGSLIRGKYMGSDSTGRQVTLIVDNKEIQVPWSLIESVRFRNKSQKEREEVKENLSVNKGLYNRLQFNNMLKSKPYSSGVDSNFGMEVLLGYRWDRFFNLGIKSGIDGYGDFYSIPLAAHYEIELRSGNFRPVLLGDFGYGFVWLNGQNNQTFTLTKGGIHRAYGFGYSWQLGKVNVLMSVMGKAQNVYQGYENADQFAFWQVRERDRVIRRLQIGLGLTF